MVPTKFDPELDKIVIEHVQKFATQNNLPDSLHKRIVVFYQIQWYYDQVIGRESLLNSLPPSLRSGLQNLVLKMAISKTQLFQMVDEDFLIMIAAESKVQILAPNEVIAYTGDMSREMHILLNGNCQTLNDSGDVLDTYSPGAQFGAIEMVYGIPKRYTTKTITTCRIISINYRSYIKAMSMFPTLMEETKQVVDEEDLGEWVHQVDNERLHAKPAKKAEKEKRTRLSWLFDCFRFILKFFESSFICTIAQCRSSKGMEKYWKPFADMGKFQFVGCFLMPLAIHPGGTFIRIWMFIRFVFIMSVCFVGPYYIAVIPYSNNLFPVMIAAAYCTYLDMYLLFHVGYYNEKGLLITHPKYTALHYLSHSFIIDALAIFPFSMIVIAANTQHAEGHHYVTHLISPHINHCTWHINLVLQFHRVQELFHYLEGDVLKDMSLIRFFKFVPLTLVIINLLASLVFGITCTYQFYEHRRNDSISEMVMIDPVTNIQYYGYLNCSSGNWLQQSQFTNIKDCTGLYLVTLYWITDTLLSIGNGDVTAGDQFTMYLIIFTILFGRLLLAYVFAHLAYGRAQFSKVMSQYQENMKDMMSHLWRESVDYTWREKLYEHFEYVWYRTGGIRPTELCRKLNTALLEDTVVLLYEKTLREVPLFENVEKSFIRVIAKHLHQEYFLKGDTIIRCFDVQADIYIINCGKVEILSSWNEMIGCMSTGGLFGNIRQVNAGFRSVSIIASRNLDVLVIPSETFYNVIKDYPKIKRNMDKLLETVTDYIMPTTILDEESLEYSLEASDVTEGTTSDQTTSSSLNETMSQGTPRRSVGSFSANWGVHRSTRQHKLKSIKMAFNICLPHKWFRFSIYPDNEILKVVNVAVLIVAYYDVLVILYFFVTQSYNPIWLYCSFALESVFYFKIFMHFHVAFMDRHGNHVTKCRKIVRHYFKDYSKVCWDAISNFPVEFFCFAFLPEDRWFVLSFFRLIHLFRMKYMFNYFEQEKNELMSNVAWNQFLRIVLFMTMGAHILACFWLMVGCPFGTCLDDSWAGIYKQADTPSMRYATAGYFVISIATTTGIGDIRPHTYIEIIITIVFMLLTRFLSALAIGDIVTMINVSSRSLVEYEYRIHSLQDFLRNQNLSDHQMKKLWRYLQNLWTEEKGQHMPKMINSCPYVLKCDIMNVMYGQHLRHSFLFHGINEALLRQLAVRLVRMVVFKGNYIVQHGDIDQNMYFIHSGEVSVLTIHPNLTETEHELLQPNEMFGTNQGLYHGLPHHFSFRAVAKASILVLNLDTWYYMLKYFPKEQELIYKRSEIFYSRF